MNSLKYFLLLACLLAFSCSSKPDGSVSSTSSPTPSSTPSLVNEAISAVKDLWEQHTTKCGDSYYSLDEEVVRKIHQYKDVSFVVRQNNPLTEADKLNGIEWKGAVEIRTRLKRDNYGDGWSDWKEMRPQQTGYMITATKRNSEWQVLQLRHITTQKRINCSDAPQ